MYACALRPIALELVHVYQVNPSRSCYNYYIYYCTLYLMQNAFSLKETQPSKVEVNGRKRSVTTRYESDIRMQPTQQNQGNITECNGCR